MPSAQTAAATSKGGAPRGEFRLRSHWQIFATFGFLVWPTVGVLCYLVYTATQPQGGSYQGPVAQKETPAVAVPYLPPAAVGAPSAAIEAIVPPQPVGKLPASSGGGPFLTNISETSGGAGEYARK